MDLKTREGRREQGELIKAAASAAGLTLKELATRLGVSHALIYQYVSGANLAQPDKLQEIALATGMPVSHFFGEAAPLPTLSEPAASTVERPEAAGPTVDSARLQGTLRQLETLAAAQEASGRDLPGLLSTLEQMLGLARLGSEPRREADILFRIGNARTDAGDLKAASDALEESLALYRELKMQDRALGAMQSLARCRSLTGSLPEAESLFREVAASANLDLTWRGLLGLGQVLEQRDHYEEAMDEYEKARQALDGLQGPAVSVRPMAELYIRTNLANVYMAEGDFDSALPLWTENQDASEELSQPDQFLEALLSEAVCSLHLGSPGLAYDRSRRGIRICRLLGDRERQAVGCACLAEALAVAGLTTEGKDQAREAARLAAEGGSSRAAGFAHLALARNLIVAEQGENALFYLDPQIASGSPRLRAAALTLRSELHRREGRFPEARDDARMAVEELQDMGALYLERAGWTALAGAEAGLHDRSALEDALGKSLYLARFTPGLPDTAWQLEYLQARHCIMINDLPSALLYARKAIERIAEMRTDLSRHGVTEASLDDSEKLQVYVEAIRIARTDGQDDLAEKILLEADWPPLAERVE